MIVEVYKRNTNEHIITLWNVKNIHPSCGKFYLKYEDDTVESYYCFEVDLRISY